MTAPTHIITGLASVVIVGHATGITPSAPSLLAMLVGTLAPDIDGNGSITKPGTILRQLIGLDLGDTRCDLRRYHFLHSTRIHPQRLLCDLQMKVGCSTKHRSESGYSRRP